METRTEQAPVTPPPRGLSSMEREQMVTPDDPGISIEERTRVATTAALATRENGLSRRDDRLEAQMQQRLLQLDQINRALRAEVREHERAEESLRASETRWHTIFAQATVGLAEISLAGRSKG